MKAKITGVYNIFKYTNNFFLKIIKIDKIYKL